MPRQKSSDYKEPAWVVFLCWNLSEWMIGFY